MPKKKVEHELTDTDKVVIAALAYTIMQRESGNKEIPRRYRRSLAQQARSLKRSDPSAVAFDVVKRLFTKALELHLISHNSLNAMDALVRVVGVTEGVASTYEQCKKQAQKNVAALEGK